MSAARVAAPEVAAADLPTRGARIRHARPFILAAYAVGLGLATWSPRPGLILTVAAAICVGILLLGPHAAAAMYTLRLERLAGGRLRWPLCIVLAGSTVLLLDHALGWSPLQLWLALPTAIVGTILGHDATLAFLSLRGAGRLDPVMVLVFPAGLGLAVVAGYSSFGLLVGSYRFAAALVASL